MKYFRLLFTFLAVIAVAPAFLWTSTTDVHASDISRTPVSGVVGTSVHVDGGGFSGRLATIYWDNQIMLSKIPISSTGEVNADLQIPEGCKGPHTIKIVDDSNWTNSTASTTFTIVPSISLFPTIGTPYSTIMVTGRGFAPFDKDIKVTWDKTVMPVYASANYLGVWSVNMDAPGPSKGEHYISAFSGSTPASEIGEHKFIAGPFAKMQPSSGPVGTEISVQGYGFRWREDGITITMDGEIIICNLIADTNGVLNDTFNLPPATQGHHLLGVFGSDFTPIGIIPDIDFNVVPSIELEPASGNKGAKVTVNGTGFAKGETVSLNFDGAKLDASFIADNKGSFSGNFVAPQSAVQQNEVKATGTTGTTASAVFVVERIIPPTPTLLSPGPGEKLAAFGSVADVFLEATRHMLGLTPDENVMQFALSSSDARFSWSQSNIPGKITYVMEIANGNDFSSPAILKKDIAESEYALSKGEGLTMGSHSWRVMAVDDLGNEGMWSEPQKFEVIPMTTQVLLIAFLIPLLFIFTVIVLAIIIWRRHKSKDNALNIR